MSMDRETILNFELEQIDGAAPGFKSEGKALGKHLKMTRSPFQFLRGAAQVFYADLAARNVELPDMLLSVPITRIMGDCHLSNFGFFTEEGSHGDSVVWAPNDFDDAAMGHASWDLLRFITSIYLTSDLISGLRSGVYKDEELSDPQSLTPFSSSGVERAVQSFVKAYTKTCVSMVKSEKARGKAEDKFKDEHFLKAGHKKAESRAAGGKKFATKSTVGKLAYITEEGAPRFKELPEKLKKVSPQQYYAVKKAFAPYVDDDILDIVLRVGAGTGSVNVDRFYLLVGPEHIAREEDFALAHVVEVKQQREAALIRHFPDFCPVNRMPPADLTVDCQRRMARRADLVLSAVNWRRSHWLLRSRHHARYNIDPTDIALVENSDQALEDYVKACAKSLARAHARGDRRSDRFEKAMADILPETADHLIEAAKAYAEMSKQDHKWLCGACGV